MNADPCGSGSGSGSTALPSILYCMLKLNVLYLPYAQIELIKCTFHKPKLDFKMCLP